MQLALPCTLFFSQEELPVAARPFSPLFTFFLYSLQLVNFVKYFIKICGVLAPITLKISDKCLLFSLLVLLL